MYVLINDTFRYPENWYNDITTPERFFSLATIYQNRIIAIIVAEVKYKRRTDREDCHILSNRFNENTKICYILSLGVNKEFRGLGIGKLFFHYRQYKYEFSAHCLNII